MLPSSVSKRKKVEKELFETLHSLEEPEFIVKLNLSEGNYLFSAFLPDVSDPLLVSIPEKFRNAFYFTPGSYAICSPIESGGKVKGEIRAVLFRKQIHHLKKLGQWPRAFYCENQPAPDPDNKSDDYLAKDMLPPSDEYDSSESDDDEIN